VASGGGKEVDVMVVSLLVDGISDDVVGGSSVVVESGREVVTTLELVMVDTEVIVDESSVLVTVDSEVTSVTIMISHIAYHNGKLDIPEVSDMMRLAGPYQHAGTCSDTIQIERRVAAGEPMM
jgi:hypothetical protein